MGAFGTFFGLSFSALLPLINPLGSALVFLGLVGAAPASFYRTLARRIAINTTLFLVVIQALGSDAGAMLRLGVYADDGAGAPLNLLFDAGQLKAGTGQGATGPNEIAINFQAAPPLIWLAAVIQAAPGTAPTFNCTLQLAAPQIGRATSASAAGNGYQMTGIQGGLPATLSGLTLISNVIRPQLHAL